MSVNENGRELSPALSLLASERPRNVGWLQAAGLLFGDWGTSRLYVLGLAFLVAGLTSFWLIAAMSLLILAVGWAYTQICRIYPDGGGVYTAGKQKARVLGVIGALLLFADYTVTASLSAVDAFHYFLGGQHMVEVAHDPPGDRVQLPHPSASGGEHSRLLAWKSPGLWALVSILIIGAFNLMGPKHTAGYAIFVAGGMIAITLLIVVAALPQIDWRNVHWGTLRQPPGQVWHGFVYIVLALSGVEAIANLTGVMRKPVYATARKAIWVVALEVAMLNLLLAVAMIALAPDRQAHKEDMLAHMARMYIGPWGEWPVRIVAGLLLLSATNTAINGLTSIMYVMSRDGEMPAIFQKLNGFGAPWVAVVLAACVPASVLLFAHDLETLAALYAIGVVGAVAINCSLCTFHPRLRHRWRKAFMGFLGLLMLTIWVTLATTKHEALIFVTVVMAIGLALRFITRYAASRRPRPSLLRQAIMEQLTPEALTGPKLLLATAGSDQLADTAMQKAKDANAALVVCFIRQVALGYMTQTGLTLETDQAGQELFIEFLQHGQRQGVPIIPMYDTGPEAAVMIAEAAAMNGVSKVMIGSSRRSTLHQFIKGSFQRRLEALLPPEIPVEVLSVPSGPHPAG